MADANKGGTPAPAGPAGNGVEDDVDIISAAAQSLGVDDVIRFPEAAKSDEDQGAEGDEDGDEADEQDDAEADGGEGDNADGDEADEQDDAEDQADDEEAEDGDQDEQDDDPEADEHAKLRAKLSPEQQKAFDKAIGKKVRKLKEAEERYGVLEQETATLRQQLAEAESKRPVAAPAGVNPLMLTDDPSDIDNREASLREFIEFAIEHEDEGYPGKEDGSDQPIDAKDLKKAKLRAERELSTVIPAARNRLAEQRKLEPYVKLHYPNLFDAKHPDSQAAKALLRQQPWLKQYPHAMLMVGFLLEGKRMTDQRDAERGKKKDPPKKDPPKIPAAKGNPPAKSPVSTDKNPAKKGGGPVNVQRFVEQGATNEALAGVVATLLD